MTDHTEALWAAKLHVKTTVGKTPGTIMDTAMTLAICKALVEVQARLDRAIDLDHGKAMQIESARALRAELPRGKLPELTWRKWPSLEEIHAMTPAYLAHLEENKKRAEALYGPGPVAEVLPLQRALRHLVDSPLVVDVSKVKVKLADLKPGEVTFIDFTAPVIPSKVPSVLEFVGSSPLQAIEVCVCGSPLPHVAPCVKTTDPEQGSEPTPVCAVCNDTHRMTLNERAVSCTACPSPCEACRGYTSAYCTKTPCACECHTKKVTS